MTIRDAEIDIAGRNFFRNISQARNKAKYFCAGMSISAALIVM
jgi:hypothetical protein